ncbi:SPARTIN [Salix viminalis]|uniref:SPARTIN n=1 Tax=Salix viminalis TaxID=40686 RepID=A0A9Q0SE78_SALVM|nr:SPARTIN [Salix viminalis]
MEAGEALELAKGDFSIVRILEDDISLATVVKIGDDLQWPLTKDEPVVKLDLLHYLFSLPMKDGDPLSYGVAFMEEYGSSLGLLDSFLCELSCFSGAEASSARSTRNVDWKEFAPNVEYYNNFLAKAIAGGTGQVVKGIFKCSNAYTNQVHKGGEMILSRAAEQKNGAMETGRSSSRSAGVHKEEQSQQKHKTCEKAVQDDRKAKQNDAYWCWHGHRLSNHTSGQIPSWKGIPIHGPRRSAPGFT